MKKYLIGVGSRVPEVLQSDKWRARCRLNREKPFNKGPFNFTAYSLEKKKLSSCLFSFTESDRI